MTCHKEKERHIQREHEHKQESDGCEGGREWRQPEGPNTKTTQIADEMQSQRQGNPWERQCVRPGSKGTRPALGGRSFVSLGVLPEVAFKIRHRQPHAHLTNGDGHKSTVMTGR